MQKSWKQCQTTTCAESFKTLQNQNQTNKQKNQIEMGKLEPPYQGTAKGKIRHLYSWCTSVWKTEPIQLATWNPANWDQSNHPWHHVKGKAEWSSSEGSGSERDWHTSTSMAQLKAPQEMEDMVPTSSIPANLHSLSQHLVGYFAQTTKSKS